MNLLFYDIVPTNLVRFYQDYIEGLSNESREFNFFFALEHEDNMLFEEVETRYSFAERFFYTQFMSSKNIQKIIVDNDIDVIFVNGQRIADDRVIYAARRCGIKTVMIQHGMYIPFMKRDLPFFFRKIKKSLSFLYYALDLSVKNDVQTNLIVNYIRSYLLGSNQIQLGIDRSEFNVDLVCVYGKYWIDFHIKQFGYSKEQFNVIGTPDLANLSSIINTPKHDDSICYIAQTLVEDGRLSKDAHIKFFDMLLVYCNNNNLKLFVKLHPRGERSLYKVPPDLDVNVEFLTTSFPHCRLYIGHYSSLLAKSMSVPGSSTLIYEYKGHSTPDYFRSASWAVVEEGSSIPAAFFKQTDKVHIEIDQYFKYNPNYIQSFISSFGSLLNK